MRIELTRNECKATRAVRLVTAIALVLAAAPPAALAATGGVAPTSAGEGTAAAAPTTSPTTPTPTTTPAAPTCPEEGGGLANRHCARVKMARLVRGRAVPADGSPHAVRRVIRAANRIRARPYVWGGGHARWWSRGYDCSGAVSFALHGGDFLESPLTSGGMMKWGAPGRGRWITVYANRRHAFAVIAGLRWDTAGDTHGTGPRWHPEMASPAGYVARHPLGY